MGKARLVVASALFLHWLAAVHMVVAVAGTSVRMPALVVVALPVLVVTAAVVALLEHRNRTERAMVAAWQARQVGDAS